MYIARKLRTTTRLPRVRIGRDPFRMRDQPDRLHPDPGPRLGGRQLVQRFASDSLWEIWFRGGTTDQNWSLQQAIRKGDPNTTRLALDELITRAPEFAEAYNQRAISFFTKTASAFSQA